MCLGAERQVAHGGDEPDGDAGHDEGQHHLHRPQHGHDGHHQPVLPGLRARQGEKQGGWCWVGYVVEDYVVVCSSSEVG